MTISTKTALQDKMLVQLTGQVLSGMMANPEVLSLKANAENHLDPDKNLDFAKDIADVAASVAEQTLKRLCLLDD